MKKFLALMLAIAVSGGAMVATTDAEARARDTITVTAPMPTAEPDTTGVGQDEDSPVPVYYHATDTSRDLEISFAWTGLLTPPSGWTYKMDVTMEYYHLYTTAGWYDGGYFTDSNYLATVSTLSIPDGSRTWTQTMPASVLMNNYDPFQSQTYHVRTRAKIYAYNNGSYSSTVADSGYSEFLVQVH